MEIATLAVGLISAGIGGITSFMQMKQQKKANKELKAARELERQRMEAQERRRRRQEIRGERIRRAQVINFANQVGAGDSSGPAGGISSLSSQLGSSQGYASHVANLNRGITYHQDRAQSFIDKGNMIAGFGSLGQSLVGGIGSMLGGGGNTYKPRSSSTTNNPYSKPGNWIEIGGSRSSFKPGFV